MSIIHVGHIKNSLVTRFGALVDLSDVVQTTADQLEAFRLTRSLAAFAVAELGDLDDAPAAQTVTDGPQDNGIDAVYFDPVEHTCFLVQAKWIHSGNGSVELGEALKFIQGIRDLLEAKFDQFNAKMGQHQDKVFSALSDTSAKFTLVLAYTGEQVLSADVQKPFDELLAEMNSPTEMVTLEVLNQARLHSIVATGAVGEAVDLEVMLHQWGLVKEPYVAYYGQVAVSDIAAWGSHGTRLTSKNLRQFKGLTEINESIGKTLSATPEKFWYFNNGITVLCDSVRKKPLGGSSTDIGTFECKGASVVNGAQTVGTIVSAAQKSEGQLASARVLVRLISLDNCPPNFADELTRAANTQNRIERRDFAALDPNQKRLRTELLLECQKEYAYQSGENAPHESVGCTLDEAAVALACAMPDVGLAVQAKREVGMLYEDIAKAPYIQLFNAGTTAKRLWNAVVTLRAIEAELREIQASRSRKEQLIAIHGNRFVSHLVFQRLRNGDKEPPDPNGIEPRIRELTGEALDVTIKLVGEQHAGAYPASLFKNASKCRSLAKSALADEPRQVSAQLPLLEVN
jgi:hypothetical protein